MARAENRKYHYIYKITCKVTNRYYIGMHSTDNLEDGYFGSGKRLWFSIDYHGKENHVKEILEFLQDRKSLKEREKEIVTEGLIGEDLCMNLVTGGEGGGFVNDEHFMKFQLAGSKAGNLAFKTKMETDVEFKQKISTLSSGKMKKNWDNGKIKPLNWAGRKHTNETILLMKEVHKDKNIGVQNPQYGTCWVTKDGLNKRIKKEELAGYINDGWVAGRFTNLRGELVKNAKLSETDVVKIKELLNNGEMSQGEIGNLFNVHKETISKIKRKLIYK